MMGLGRLVVNWNMRKSTSMQLLLLPNSRSLSSLSSDLNSSSKSSLNSSSSKPRSVSSLSTYPYSSSKSGSVSSLSIYPYSSSKSGPVSSLSNKHLLKFEFLRRQSVLNRIMYEHQTAKFSDEIKCFKSMNCLEGFDYDTLKSLLKDLRKYNRKNNNYSITNHKNSEISLLMNKKDCKKRNSIYCRPQFGYVRSRNLKLDTDAPSICQMAQLVLKQYNKEKKSKFEFVSVLRAYLGNTRNSSHILVQACDPLAARVPIKLKALCERRRNNKYVVEQLQIFNPVPFMICKDETDRPNLSRSYTETLLFANIRGCPIINKRLGLKRLCGLRFKNSRPHVVKVSLEDDTLLSLAECAFNQQKENQRVRLICLGIVGAWREMVADERVLHHIMFKVMEGKVERKFYAAVATKSNNEDVEVLNWVVADSFKAKASFSFV